MNGPEAVPATTPDTGPTTALDAAADAGARALGWSWRDEFHPFTTYHLLVAGALLALMLGLSVLGRSWKARGPDGELRERKLRVAWGWFIVCWQTCEVTWYLLPGNLSIDKSFPLHVCDLAAWVAAASLLSERRSWRTMIYYWGLALCTQAFLTPTVGLGYAHAKFWFFWGGHTHIVGAALYAVIAGGYRPAWRDFRLAFAVSLLYAALIIPFDVALGVGYGYLGPTKPAARSVLDSLGPWPLRIAPIAGIAIAMMAAATAVWTLRWPRAQEDRARTPA